MRHFQHFQPAEQWWNFFFPFSAEIDSFQPFYFEYTPDGTSSKPASVRIKNTNTTTGIIYINLLLKVNPLTYWNAEIILYPDPENYYNYS